MKKLFIFAVLFTAILFIYPKSTQAVTFDLLAPTGQLSSGQNVNFTINVDTEAHSFTSIQIGMTYDASVLEYVSISPGTTFPTVSVDPQSGGKMIVTGSSTDGYTGSGSFAVVTFKIIATSSGSSQLCALFNPTNPTSSPAPQPTALPVTGSFAEASRGIIFGLTMIGLAVISLVFFRKL